MTQKHRAKCNGTAGTIRETSGRKERLENINNLQVNMRCNEFFRRNGMPEQEVGSNSGWRKK